MKVISRTQQIRISRLRSEKSFTLTKLTMKAMSRTQQLIVALVVLLLPLAHAKKLPDASEFLVQGLEDVEPAYGLFEGSMYSGLLPMDNGDRHGELMFWLFASEKPTVKDTLTIWLNGGPGCSSFNCGVMFENSPITIPLRPAGYCCVSRNEPLVYNQYAWTNATHMLYVEQPVGVGFSHGGPEPKDEADLSGDFFAFVQNFYRVFPQYQKAELFIVGESYAGMYAPSIAHKIYTEMKDFKSKSRSNADLVYINLAGIGLGNGWVDARVQGPATIDYAYFHGMMDMHTRDMLHAEWDRCITSGPSESLPDPFHPFNVPDDCAMSLAVLMAGGKLAWPSRLSGPNTYDVTTWDPYAIILGGESSVEDFFNKARVKEILHAPAETYWQGCIPGAGRRRLLPRQDEHKASHGFLRRLMATLLMNDQPESTVPYIAELLDGGVRVIAYNGDRDLSCCAAGTEKLLNDMQWSGADEWYTTKRGLWTVGKEPAGYAKSLKGLDFVVVYNSGHLVPYNQPLNALDLITRFLKNESFSDHELPSFDFSKTAPSTPVSEKEKKSRGFWTVLVAFVAGLAVSYIWQRKKHDYRQISDHGAGIDEMTSMG